MARDHRGVAEAVPAGWADAGVCLRLAAEECGIDFLPICREQCDLCYCESTSDEPPVQALLQAVQSRTYRALLGDLPGYDAADAGEVIRAYPGGGLGWGFPHAVLRKSDCPDTHCGRHKLLLLSPGRIAKLRVPVARLPIGATINGAGMASLQVAPEKMRMRVIVSSAGKDMMEALANLKTLEDSDRKKLADCGAADSVIVFDDPVAVDPTTNQQMQMRGRMSGAKAKPKRVVVSAVLKSTRSASGRTFRCARYLLCLIALFLALVFAPTRRVCGDAPPVLHYRVETIGNSFGGNPAWVQGDARALCVTGDGVCMLNCPWDEAGQEVGFYRNAKVIGAAPHTHGWGYHGGMAVAANAKYIFFAQVVENEVGHLSDPGTWPAKDHQWLGISRRFRDGQAAAFPGGKGGAGETARQCFLPIDDLPAASGDLDKTASGLQGLAADERHVFVSDGIEQKIRIYDADSMRLVSAFDIAHPRQIALDRDGSLWVIQAGDRMRVAHFSAAGKKLPDDARLSAEIESPAAIACDRLGHLIVADNGPSQQIKIFDEHSDAGGMQKPHVIGEAGGVLAPPRGKVGPLRFNGLTGVGVDDAGNLYVACNGIGNNTELPVQRTGLALQRYHFPVNGDDKSPPALAWQLLGLEFVDCGDFDPADPASVYTIHQHFRLHLDENPTLAGGDWSYEGYTLDRFAFPQDPRLHTSPASVFARRIGGRLVIYGTDMYADFMQIYRPIDQADPSGKAAGQTLIPCGFFSPKHLPSAAWPPFQPRQGRWIWRDINGNGAFDAGEYAPQLLESPKFWGWWVDSRGDIWQAGERNTITHFPCAGLDSHGAPIYSFNTAQSIRGPLPFNNLQRLEYFPDTDTMYLSGYSAALPNARNNWKTIGKIVCRYDHWSAGPQKRWEIHVPFDEAQEQSATYGTPVAMSAAGDYLFIVYLKTAEVRVFNAATGDYIGVMNPPKGSSGWVDIPYGIRACKRANGEYLVIVEEDWKSKNLLYRWKP